MSAASCRASPAASPPRTDLKLDGLGDGVAAAPFRLQLQLILVGLRQGQSNQKVVPTSGSLAI